jgi:soluble lytic murein transglycosylase-like protein
MAHYADHPEAARLYKLALRRKPARWRAPNRPVRPLTLEASGASDADLEAQPRAPRKRLSRAQYRKSRQFRNRIRRNLNNGWTLAAKNLLANASVKALLSDVEYDRARARLAHGYFIDGRDEWALDWATKASKRSGKYVPQAYWTAGLAAWRMNNLDLAAEQFGLAAQGKGLGAWLTSASAFWAARSHLVNRQPEQVNRWLIAAAAHPRTFYGMLAARMLGRETSFNWTTPAIEQAAFKALTEKPRGRRSMALVQVGQTHRAERELTILAAAAAVTDPNIAQGMLVLAARANMPALAMRLDARLYPNGGGYDGASYPVAAWEPKGGYRVDRALIFALIRQESAFNPKAKSWAGASGLMQLMPRTASFVARDRRLHGSNRRALFEPELNLSIGQRYIEMLRDDQKIAGGLFQIAAAWNGGPGNLARWRRKTDHRDDPLLFIEAIPSRETRNFIERVLTNLWVYRSRLGQRDPSLDAIAAGEWPVYMALDPDIQIAGTDGSTR